MRSALLIDLDDTLLQGPLVSGVMPYVFNEYRKHNPELDDSSLTRDMIDILESRYAQKRVDAFDWDELFTMVAMKHNIPARFSIEKLMKEYARPPYIRVYDHVHDALLELRKDKNRVLAITTNGFWRYQGPTVKALGLMDYFDYILAPDILSCIKGEKRFYQHILESVDMCITIGDRYDADVEWPIDLGFHAIWIPTHLPPEIDPGSSPFARAQALQVPSPFHHKPDAIIINFQEIVSTVREIEHQSIHGT